MASLRSMSTFPEGTSSRGCHIRLLHLRRPLLGGKDDVVGEELSEVLVRLLASVVADEAVLDGTFAVCVSTKSSTYPPYSLRSDLVEVSG